MKIGVLSGLFRLPIDRVIDQAEILGIHGIQGNGVQGELLPEILSPNERKQLLRRMKDANLEFSALFGDLGGHGFQLRSENKEKISRSCKIVDLACDLETSIITTHIGVVPEDSKSETYQIMQEACFAIGNYAQKNGIVFGIETGPESPERLKTFLDSLGSKGLGVNYDPANLVMVLDEDPVQGVRTLAEYIVHTHAKDGIHLHKCDPVALYDAFAEEGIEGFDFGTYFNETPIGEGSVDWAAYVQELKRIGYDGFLTIEREIGETSFDDISKSVKLIRNLLER